VTRKQLDNYGIYAKKGKMSSNRNFSCVDCRGEKAIFLAKKEQ